MKRPWRRLGLVLGGIFCALVSGELASRLLPAAGPRYETFFEDARRQPADLEGAAGRGEVRLDFLHRRPRWLRAATYYLCYRHNPRPALDARGCIPIQINKMGIRDREDLTYESPAQVQRVLCLGDSFTFGWGVRIQDAWVRLIEGRVHGAPGRPLRTINCGGPWTLFVDEYLWGLEHRFDRFEADAVLVTICLNDLVPMPSTLGWFRKPPPPAWLAWSDLVRRLWRGGPAAKLESGVDWGRLLLDLPDTREAVSALSEARVARYLAAFGLPDPGDPARAREGLWLYVDRELFAKQDMARASSWHNGGPQKALAAMRDWCRARGRRFGVVVWPLFQGLDTARSYPFTTLHRVVGEFCRRQGIPLLDLLPAFLGRDARSLWVDPSDQHGNEAAQRIAAEPIARFVEALLR